MIQPKFRIKSVRIKGFKGFTREQEITLDCRNTFIFSPNSYGKTSILEAVAWCLFGLYRGGSEADIRNRDYYSEECAVELVLLRGTEQCTIVRSLRAASLTSEVKVILANGEQRGLEETFPERKRLGGQGTDVLFAAQGIARRSVGDITNFKDVISAHLGLDEIEDLRKLFSDSLNTFQQGYKDREKKWKEFETGIDHQIENSRNDAGRIAEIIGSEGKNLPKEETTDRINKLHSELESSTPPVAKASALGPEEIVQQISALIEQASKTGINQILIAIQEKEQQSRELTTIKNEYSAQLQSKAEIQKQFDNLSKEKQEKFDGLTADEINKSITLLDNELLRLQTALEKEKQGSILKRQQLREEQNGLQVKLENMNQMLSKKEPINLELQHLNREYFEMVQAGSDVSLEARKAELERDTSSLELYKQIITQVNEYCKDHGYVKCPICDSERNLGDILGGKMRELPSEARKIVEELENTKQKLTRIKSIKDKQTELENQLNHIQQQLSEIQPNSIAELQNRINKLGQELVSADTTLNSLEKVFKIRQDEIMSGRQSLQAKLQPLSQLEYNLSSHLQSLQVAKANALKMEDQLRSLLSFPNVNQDLIQTLEDYVRKLGDELASLRQRQADSETAIRNYRARLSQLKIELQYHSLHLLVSELIAYKSGRQWQEAEKAFADYCRFLDALGNIENALRDVYKKRLDLQLVSINQRLGPVYQTLTEQRSYPRVQIKSQTDNLGRLEVLLLVGTESDSWRRPEEVLNEQARNAIRLLPYFVFSELGMLQHDFDFLLIDDPSRSFDTSHLESLISLLQPISSQVQIIVATHERERFEPRIGILGNPTVMVIKDFKPLDGPSVVPL